MKTSTISRSSPVAPPVRRFGLKAAGLWLAGLMIAGTASAACVDGGSLKVISGFQPQASLSAGFSPAVFRPDTNPVARLIKVDFGNDRGDILDRIVGTWRVKYTGFTGPAEAFIQWHSDGTEWENIALPILGGTICMGDWRAVDRNHVRRSHVGWLFSAGQAIGYFTETETDEVARDGNSYQGTNLATGYDFGGHVLFNSVPGTAIATRISQP
jgi:hypothetical protein